MSLKYILDGKNPVRCDDLLVWAQWFETSNRRVALTELSGKTVSTVFLGIDHRFFGDGPPLLFETMTFGDDEEGCERTSSWEEAEEAHDRAVKAISD